MMGTTCRNNTISPEKGSGNGLRSTTSTHTHMAWLNPHMTRPVVIRLQNRRVCPRLSQAFLAEGMQAAAITSSGIRSPMAVRKKGLGNTAGTRAKASSRPTPQRSDGMGRRDNTFHDTTFATLLYDDGSVTSRSHGNRASALQPALCKKTGRDGACPVSVNAARRVFAGTGRGFCRSDSGACC